MWHEFEAQVRRAFQPDTCWEESVSLERRTYVGLSSLTRASWLPSEVVPIGGVWPLVFSQIKL